MKTVIKQHNELVAKFESLAALEDGWFEGIGQAPDKKQLALVSEHFLDGYPEKLDLPTIVPTQDGNLLFEWKVLGSPSVDLYLTSLRAEFHAFAPDGTDIERDFVLDNAEAWAAFFAFLNDNVEPAAQ